jgi:hypothetical protein
MEYCVYSIFIIDKLAKFAKLSCSMGKKYSWKIWAIFWILAAVLLAGWFVFLQIKYKNTKNLKAISNFLPIGSERKNEISAALDIFRQVSGSEEKKYLVLFQNNLEIRPGGGFIGAFAVMKISHSQVRDIQVFDTGVFDKSTPNVVEAPRPIAEILGTQFWKMKDSNWSPDFRKNAKEAERFYQMGTGENNIDSVVAINTDVLNSILALTGPVVIEGYPGEYRNENAILQLEYQVEKGYIEQGIAKGERKNIMSELADVIEQKVQAFTFSEQLALARELEKHLKQKDIQLFWSDENLQKEIESLGWGGRVKDSSGDYLMVVDANLLALKSDYCIKRKMEYDVDLSGETPQVVLNITYEHVCRVKDWMTTNYRDWLRVYAPAGSYLEETSGQTGEVQFSDELGKKVFGMRVDVPIGETKKITLKYILPQNVKDKPYTLLVQKQSGSGVVPITISVKYPDGSEVKAQEALTGDKEFGF